MFHGLPLVNIACLQIIIQGKREKQIDQSISKQPASFPSLYILHKELQGEESKALIAAIIGGQLCH